MMNTDSPLQDRFGRGVEYLRLSVTDRCDFRCVYCMSEDMTFLPRAQILSLEQLYDIASSFVRLGVKKIRLTGGEPLVRNNVMSLVERLGQLEQLEQLHLTTNGAQLDKFAAPLKAAGLTGMNISIDSLQPDRFKELTRFGELKKVLNGIDAACDAGFQRLKLNAVILKGRNDDEILDLVDFARDKHIDISFIEEMPLGNISEHDRALSFISSEQIRTTIETRHGLTPTTENTGGPSRYYRMADSTSRVGFISPHSNNFCHLCNRVRLTVEGRLLLCLGNEHSVSLKELVDEYPGDHEKLREAIIKAMDLKPERHHFSLDEDEPQIVRFMNTTGG
ncbi:GTP 3',8-cyclase MoaA [Zhongshania aliphaticivorans]|uniref:GTP 3',8-cyclase MoaA n=1 Tax=Zhongshania aliphaticivorans TaxID=1470434 RepID=UPI0012E603A3|nr:GTP 3',8-cyclase MoaA [Zhongshania aliphaticivorans]MBU0539821.1 GTP 3',8-cyclase MoaA [Gammaproteobacteria bacterium]MBU1832556.1 GTP 3',8-cyclase MoaA [Gammaproteobacteria bacterium]CAA0092058.1 GTP 3',8-cyclase [Zhongshania aliphaticivorans]